VGVKEGTKNSREKITTIGNRETRIENNKK
jgi:hypothetical protein